MYLLRYCCFFFFKQKTAYEMRISDWSSDVCSSDLSVPRPEPEQASARRECLARMRLPKRLRPCEALPRLAAVMAGYLGRSPAAARYPPMAWIPIAAIPLGSSRVPSAPPILVELREIRRPALGEGGESLLGLDRKSVV